MHKHRLAESTVTKVPSWHFGSAGGTEGEPSCPDSGRYCLHCTTQELGLVPVNCSTELPNRGHLTEKSSWMLKGPEFLKPSWFYYSWKKKKKTFLKTQHAVQRHPTSDGFILWEAIWPLMRNSLLLRNIWRNGTFVHRSLWYIGLSGRDSGKRKLWFFFHFLFLKKMLIQANETLRSKSQWPQQSMTVFNSIIVPIFMSSEVLLPF